MYVAIHLSVANFSILENVSMFTSFKQYSFNERAVQSSLGRRQQILSAKCSSTVFALLGFCSARVLLMPLIFSNKKLKPS